MSYLSKFRPATLVLRCSRWPCSPPWAPKRKSQEEARGHRPSQEETSQEEAEEGRSGSANERSADDCSPRRRHHRRPCRTGRHLPRRRTTRGRTPPPDEGSSKDSETKDKDKDEVKEKPDAPTPKGHLTALDLSLGLRGFQRHLAYTDKFGQMPKYDISGAPAIALGAGWYPGASAGGFVGSIGLTAGFEYGFGFNSSYKTPPAGEDPKKYSTKAYQYALGLRFRIPFGGSEMASARNTAPKFSRSTSSSHARSPRRSRRQLQLRASHTERSHCGGRRRRAYRGARLPDRPLRRRIISKDNNPRRLLSQEHEQRLGFRFQPRRGDQNFGTVPNSVQRSTIGATRSRSSPPRRTGFRPRASDSYYGLALAGALRF